MELVSFSRRACLLYYEGRSVFLRGICLCLCSICWNIILLIQN